MQMLARGCKQYFREFWALKDVSFDIKKGETVGIIGRNGSGKSTLLQMICGTLTPSGGTMETNGRIAALLELGSGFNPEFTGRENIYLNGAVLGLSNKDIDARFNDIAAFADIGDFIEQPVKTYSSGMMMRLAFAVVAHVDADILIIDEALSVGDAVFIQKCNLFLRRFINSGTLLFVSHSMQSVLELCNRVVWLKNGQTRMDGVAKEVVRHYNAYVHQQINVDKIIHVSEKAVEQPVRVPSAQSTDDSVPGGEPVVKFSAKVFAFDFSSAYWGTGGASITNIEVLDVNGNLLDAIGGCGFITIRVHCSARVELRHPIVGFSIRNQRGVEIISENTSLGYLDALPPVVAPDVEFYADFRFFLPYLPVGEYFLGGAVADRPGGEMHVQHHRRDDALRISVVSSHVVYGMFSMPMDHCSIEMK
jgi:lipopolysaccharide transport system ATP-binding protein